MAKLANIKWDEVALFLILFISYIYFFPRWADPNQNSRLDMVVAVVEDGAFQIDKYVENTVDYAKVGEHYYSDKAPGVAWLGIPLYAGLKLVLDSPVMESVMNKLAASESFQATLRAEGSGILLQKVRFALAQVVLTYVISGFATALLGLLLYRFSAYFTPKISLRIGLVLGYGLLTPAFAYAGALYGHQLSALLLFAVFYLIFTRQKKLSAGLLLAVGFLLGYSVITEYPTVLMAGILFLYTLYKLYQTDNWLKIGWLILSGLLVAGVWMAYNNAIFGGPLELGYSYSELWTDQHQTGFMSLGLPHWDAIWGITFGKFRGLFVLSPWLLLAAPGFWLWWRSGVYRAEWTVALASVLTIFSFNASSIMWWGGFSIGPRYLLPMLPMMTLAVAFVFRAVLERAWFKGVLAFLYGWSFVAVWGVTLAEQAFPPDTIRTPWLDYVWPNWQIGNIARNLGTILGFSGPASLLPLFITLLIISGGCWFLYHWSNNRIQAGARLALRKT